MDFVAEFVMLNVNAMIRSLLARFGVWAFVSQVNDGRIYGLWFFELKITWITVGLETKFKRGNFLDL
jgi:hypothetical protein